MPDRLDDRKENNYQNDMQSRRRHEIYLGGPGKTAPENLKTIIRHTIIKV